MLLRCFRGGLMSDDHGAGASAIILSFFLGVIALSSLVQAAFLIGLAVGGRRLARRLVAMQRGIDREIRPTLDNLSRITRNLTEIADLATLQARRVDDLLADTVDKIEE